MKAIALSALLILLPVLTEASPIIKISTDIKKDCQNVSDIACYVMNAKTIYISDRAEVNLIPYLFYHEYGHHLISRVSKEKVKEMFGYSSSYTKKDILELSADHFYVYMYAPQYLPEKERVFWKEILRKDLNN